ncbi:MAG: hypothetical protein ORN57_04245, partial [Alphaproteobacteria bacterium]|nr:hypothetical protein [Alphaproteobacteria bacterium]
MFSGLIQSIASVDSFEDKSDVRVLWLRTPWPADSIALGASIAVNGICLTVAALAPSRKEPKESQGLEGLEGLEG